MVYVLPEMVIIILLEIAYGVLSFVILFSYYGNICCKNCCGVNSCLHSILKRTNIVKNVSETTTEFYGFLIEENSSMMYFLVWYILWILFGAAIVFLDVFLIEVTNSCDPFASRTNCFLNSGFSNHSAFYDEPIDCNKLTDLPDNATFICYRYTLDLGGAFGTAGGFFATGMMFLSLIAACYGKQTRCCNEDNCCNIVGLIHMAVGALLSFIVLVVVPNVPALEQILMEGSSSVLLQFIHILLSLTILHTLFMAIMLQRMLCTCRPKQEEQYELNLV